MRRDASTSKGSSSDGKEVLASSSEVVAAGEDPSTIVKTMLSKINTRSESRKTNYLQMTNPSRKFDVKDNIQDIFVAEKGSCWKYQKQMGEMEEKKEIRERYFAPWRSCRQLE
eukprot:GHVT01084297.1.p1 GENE.GHVT01084297.1~~GHVT01084297.1.p1  ORF type:complete len:113 (+),score=14.32 GHVT01084297.1:3308-3646(+)